MAFQIHKPQSAPGTPFSTAVRIHSEYSEGQLDALEQKHKIKDEDAEVSSIPRQVTVLPTPAALADDRLLRQKWKHTRPIPDTSTAIRSDEAALHFYARTQVAKEGIIIIRWKAS